MTKTNEKTINFLLVGVGGQGAILASDVLAGLGLELGYDVKKAEVHGMSQRGGSVNSSVRWGKKVNSPILSKGEADYYLAFEKSEAVRFIDYVRPGGVVITNDYAITPLSVSSGDAVYPTDAQIKEALSRFSKKVTWVKGLEIAEELGNAKVANTVLLGALSAHFDIDVKLWLEVLKKRVPPKAMELNQKAFMAGREAVKK